MHLYVYLQIDAHIYTCICIFTHIYVYIAYIHIYGLNSIYTYISLHSKNKLKEAVAELKMLHKEVEKESVLMYDPDQCSKEASGAAELGFKIDAQSSAGR